MAVFEDNGCLSIKLRFWDPNILVRNRLTYFVLKSLLASWLGARGRTPEKYPSKENGVRNRACVETKRLNRSEAKICTVADRPIPNANGPANFGDDRLSGFGVAVAGVNFTFP